MIVIDSSAWIEFLRDTGSPICQAVDDLLPGDLAISDPILMEILAGARDEVHLLQLRGLLGRAHLLHCTPPDYVAAAAFYRRCRRGGETVRRLIDCLIAAVTVRNRLPILHLDADFDVLGRHTELVIHRLD